MFVEVAKVNEIAKGGLKAVEVNGKEIVLCNYGGNVYAVDRRCGHMNAPLDRGTLEDYILTCPLHHVQFDITTGEALSRPIPHEFSSPLPDEILKSMRYEGGLMRHIRVHNIRTYPVKIEGDSIKVDVRGNENK